MLKLSPSRGAQGLTLRAITHASSVERLGSPYLLLTLTDSGSTIWCGIEPAQARELAGALIVQAESIDGGAK